MAKSKLGPSKPGVPKNIVAGKCPIDLKDKSWAGIQEWVGQIRQIGEDYYTNECIIYFLTRFLTRAELDIVRPLVYEAWPDYTLGDVK